MQHFANDNTRIHLIDAAMGVMTSANNARQVVSIHEEARRLYAAFPESGMAEADIRELLAKLATQQRLTVVFG